MKILILGAKGMLGGELRRVFVGHDIVPWDFEDLDITREAEVGEKIGALRPDIIINAAAYNNVDKAEEDRETAEILNGRAVGFLAQAAKNAGATFVHYSTDYVFDGTKVDGYMESDEPKPLGAYGASKLMGERDAQKADKFYIIRLSRLFGKMGTGQNVKKSFVDIMMALADAKKEIEVVDEEMSSPTYAPDIAERTKYIIESGLPNGVYHSANAGECTWCGFAAEIFREDGKNVKIIPVSGEKFPRKALRPKFSVLLNTKLPPMRPWQEALKEYLKCRI